MRVPAVRSPSLVIAVFATMFASSLNIAVARASCREPELALLWSYPADGSDNVPTNALLWALSNNWTVPRATLDGIALPIPVTGVHGVELGALAPQRDYVLRLDYGPGWQVDAGGPRVFEIRFRTGAGPASEPPAVPVLGVQRADGIGHSACTDVVNAQDCFDTGQNTLVTFDVSDADAIGWQVGNEIWPARCGKPSLYLHRERSERCYPVSAIGMGGRRSETTQYCLESPDAGRPMDTQAPSPDAGSGPDSGKALGQPSGVAFPDSSSGGSCSAAPERPADKTQPWLLLLLGATCLARARRTKPQQ